MKVIPNLLQVATTGGTCVLTDVTVDTIRFAGSSAHTLQLPAANTLPVGWPLELINSAPEAITIKNGSGDTIASLPAAIASGSTSMKLLCLYNVSVGGIWDLGSIPAAVLTELQNYQPITE